MTWVYNPQHETKVSDLDAISRWPTIVGVCVSLTILMTITVGLRIYVRARMIKSLGIDDYVMIFSMICSIIYNSLCIGQSRYSEINFAGRPFYQAGICGFKVALCFAYLRITGHNIKSGYRKIIWTFMIFTILSHLGGALVLFFQCSPVRASWCPKVPRKCLPNDITFYVLAAISIFCDLIIFLMPIPLLARLQINTRRKVALITIFMLGLFTTICSIMRTVQISVIAKTQDSTMLVLWGTIEMNVGIFLTCLPSLTPLFTYFANKSKASSYGRRTRGANGTNNSVKLQKVSQLSAHSGSTGVAKTDSEEHIMHVHGKGNMSITKTTDFDIQDYDKEQEVLGGRGW